MFNDEIFSGLGYIMSSQVALATGSWRWGLRVTPGFGYLCVLLIVLVLKDPQRGQSEGINMRTTSWWSDLKYLFTK